MREEQRETTPNELKQKHFNQKFTLCYERVHSLFYWFLMFTRDKDRTKIEPTAQQNPTQTKNGRRETRNRNRNSKWRIDKMRCKFHIFDCRILFCPTRSRSLINKYLLKYLNVAHVRSFVLLFFIRWKSERMK